MQYIKRTAERKFLSMSSVFKAVMVVGARQVGKSTMLKHLAKNDDRTYVSMDDSKLRELAQSDPELFFQAYPPPILIDEVQKAPELFEQIKIICDNTDRKGLFWLTGSQSKKLLQKAGDSLAGRICIMRMYSMSYPELLGMPEVEPAEFSFAALQKRSALFPSTDIVKLYSHIWRGGMPDVQSLDSEQLQEYFNSYIETYLMRDAVDDNGISDTVGFRRFLRACAAFNGQMLNKRDLAAAADISVITATNWLKVLINMGIVCLLEPFFSNELKRLTKTPKLYFCDTGLCAYLSSWTGAEPLMNGAASGHYFESYAVGELLRMYEYGKEKVNMNYYRDSNQKEIDIIVENNGILHPLEIKKNTAPGKKAIAAFSLLQKSGKQVGTGGVICMAQQPLPIDAVNSLIPIGML